MNSETEQKNTMPNFLIIGAAKSGTSALYHYLKQHPQIYMSPIKEPYFFAFEGEKLNYKGPGVAINDSSITDIESYRSLFKGVSDEVAIGEASTLYLYVPKASTLIQHYVPNIKLIVILRNPVDRAYSSFMHLIRDEREPITDFAQALKAEESRIKDNWGFLWRYQDFGFYSVQLERYFEKFDRSQIKVFLYDDFKREPITVLQEICSFLNVDQNFMPDMSVKRNVGGVPKNKLLQKFLKKKPGPVKNLLKKFIPYTVGDKIRGYLISKNLAKTELQPELRSQLVEVYRQDILKLQDLIEQDLSKWLK